MSEGTLLLSLVWGLEKWRAEAALGGPVGKALGELGGPGRMHTAPSPPARLSWPPTQKPCCQ